MWPPFQGSSNPTVWYNCPDHDDSKFCPFGKINSLPVATEDALYPFNSKATSTTTILLTWKNSTDDDDKEDHNYPPNVPPLSLSRVIELTDGSDDDDNDCPPLIDREDDSDNEDDDDVKESEESAEAQLGLFDGISD